MKINELQKLSYLLKNYKKRKKYKIPGLYNSYGNLVLDWDCIRNSTNYRDAFIDTNNGILIKANDNGESFFKHTNGILVLSSKVNAIRNNAFDDCYGLKVIACDGIHIFKDKCKIK